jgi:hypothetical protein
MITKQDMDDYLEVAPQADPTEQTFNEQVAKELKDNREAFYNWWLCKMRELDEQYETNP